MMPWPPSWNYDVILEIPLCQWMHIYSKNNPAKFHPNPTRYDGALSISKEVAPTTTKDEKRYKISSWSNKKVSYCCDSWLYCMQYFNAIFIVIATSRPLNKKICSLSVRGSNNYCRSASTVRTPLLHLQVLQAAVAPFTAPCHCWQTSRAVSTTMHTCSLNP